MTRPMHLRDRKLKTCKNLVGLHADNGKWDSEGTEGITFHQYISSKD